MRHGHEMDVVVHNAVGQQFQTVAFAMITQPPQILPTVVVVEEYILTAISPLRYVIGHIFDYQPCSSWHAGIIYQRNGFVKIGVCGAVEKAPFEIIRISLS